MYNQTKADIRERQVDKGRYKRKINRQRQIDEKDKQTKADIRERQQDEGRYTRKTTRQMDTKIQQSPRIATTFIVDFWLK